MEAAEQAQRFHAVASAVREAGTLMTFVRSAGIDEQQVAVVGAGAPGRAGVPGRRTLAGPHSIRPGVVGHR